MRAEFLLISIIGINGQTLTNHLLHYRFLTVGIKLVLEIEVIDFSLCADDQNVANVSKLQKLLFPYICLSLPLLAHSTLPCVLWSLHS